MNDETLIEIIAYIWTKCGGDATGFDFLKEAIRDKIKEIE